MKANETSEMPVSTSSVYAFINDYVTPSIDNELKKFMPSFGNPDKYRLIKMIGSGKYSVVFSAVAVKQNSKIERDDKNKKKLYAIKILKDVAFARIKRELYILKRVSASEPFPMTIPSSKSLNFSDNEKEFNALASNIKHASIEDFSKFDSQTQFPVGKCPVSSFSVPKNSLADIQNFDFNLSNFNSLEDIKKSDTFCSSSFDDHLSEQKVNNYENEDSKTTESIVRLIDVNRDELTGTISIVTEYIKADPPKHLYPTLTLDDIRFYMYRLLKALDVCHSRGVMHRDIKPGNVLISKSFVEPQGKSFLDEDDQVQRNLTIIDWGLAELYYPMKRYSTRVATMRYKAPELLLQYPFYDYGVDVWGAGCIMLEMLFEFGFIRGSTNQQVLFSISKLWGQKRIQYYATRYGLDKNSTFLAYNEILSNHPNSSEYDRWAENVALRMRPSVRDGDALDLLKKLLEIDHGERISARDALRHKFFLPLFKSNPKEMEMRMKMQLSMEKQKQMNSWNLLQKKMNIY